MGVPYYATIGNHDLFQSGSSGGWDTWKSTFGPATYSVTIASKVRILFIDTSSGEIGATQFQWLEAQLANNTVPYVFVASHYPIYDGMTPVMWRLSSVGERYKLMSILNKYSVYGFLGGHIHGYRQTQVGPTLHFTIGSMYPYSLDFGSAGFVMFSYATSGMSWQWVGL